MKRITPGDRVIPLTHEQRRRIIETPFSVHIHGHPLWNGVQINRRDSVKAMIRKYNGHNHRSDLDML